MGWTGPTAQGLVGRATVLPKEADTGSDSWTPEFIFVFCTGSGLGLCTPAQRARDSASRPQWSSTLGLGRLLAPTCTPPTSPIGQRALSVTLLQLVCFQ